MMNGPGDDLILEFPVQCREQGAVSGHFDNQVGVILGMGLGVQQRFFGDHVELGHFIDVLALIIAMMATKAIMVKIYKSLGETAPSEP